jgi:hypothetical protein
VLAIVLDFDLLARVGAGLILALLGAMELNDVSGSFIGWNAGNPRNASSLFSAG